MPLDKHREYTFLNDLVSMTTLEELEHSIVEYCCSVFGAKTVAVIRFHCDAEPMVLLHHIPDQALLTFFSNRYTRIGFMLDPFYFVAFREPEISAHQLREIAPDRLETSEYYASYYSATGLIDELGATIRLDARVALHLSLGRMRGDRRFRASDLRYFRLLAPLLMNKLKAVTQSAPSYPRPVNAPDLIERCHHLSAVPEHTLSRREAEIAALVVQGHSSRAAGLQLGISDLTVKVHRRNLYRKLQISSRNELFSLLEQRLS